MPVAVTDVLRTNGRPLDAGIRGEMEARFDRDFSEVRLHTGTLAADSAASVDARAFTAGTTIVFGANQYEPDSVWGRELLGHELTHVVQQRGDQANGTALIDDRYEAEAEGVGQSVAAGYAARPELLHGAPALQPKLKVQGSKEATDFQWFLTAKDAANFETHGRGPADVVLKPTADPAKVEDSFRFNLIKTIIDDPTQTLLIRYNGMDDPAPPHDLYEDGKIKLRTITPTLRAMGKSILGAAGVTVPAAARALALDPLFSGPASPRPNESWILYSEPWALAHEFGHAFLMFSGAAWQHSKMIGAKLPIPEPGGGTYTGGVNEYISSFVEEQLTDILDPETGLHFSPTAVRNWPEPGSPTGFRGTWLEFKAKHPRAKVSAKSVTAKGKTTKTLEVCVPKPGEICF